MDRADYMTLRCELTAAKNQLASLAAEFEHNGQPQRADWLKVDVARAEAALLGAGSYVRWCRGRVEELAA